MWGRGWREQCWDRLQQPWDLIVIGGGITGAGILREAARVGLHVLLVEAGDFASGTSSRSSKLVHGGLRYLKNAQFRLTLDSVRERERLLHEGRGLITPLAFLMPGFESDRIPGWVFGIGLTLYDVLALQWGHRHYDPAGLRELCPPLSGDGLLGGYRYFDAQTDDARLVLRLIREGVHDGGMALNYCRVDGLLRSRSGQVRGVILHDQATQGAGLTAEIQAPVVVNATGAWADDLRGQVGGRPRLRKLRGSHLVFPTTRFPLQRAVSLLHPSDARPVFAFPWEGVTIVGTTDVDHAHSLSEEPAISPAEADYLLDLVRWAFPSLHLSLDDAMATYAGVRPVIDTGKADPSKESREYVLWDESGLLTITGGKLTTFRRMAQSALRAVRRRLPGSPTFDPRLRVLDEPPEERCVPSDLPPAACSRLIGRYGADAPGLVACAQAGELEPIGSSSSLWAEVRWASRQEAIVHLDDLLLRRVRIGLTLAQGGAPWMDRIRAIAQPELGWDDARWESELSHYCTRWQDVYAWPR